MKIQTEKIRGAQIDLGIESFYHYCVLRMPLVYTENRPHLRVLCDDLQSFIESDKSRLILNMPPRHGKTLSVELLTEWVLGKTPETGIIVACYNETLSSRFSKQVRGDIMERPVDNGRLVFSDYFPGVKIKEGDAAMQLWALEGHHFSFLATSPGGTLTGAGAQLLIIDDLIKNSEEAFNERILDEHWLWYINTALSRIEAGGKQIIIQTRWATQDLTGKLITFEPDKWQVITMPAMLPDGSMLCEDILSKEEYLDREKKTDPVIMAGNYQQKPYDSLDKLYPNLREYDPAELPEKAPCFAYVDTADEGADYLAGATYLLHKGIAYITDVLYTKEAMEITEAKAARMLTNAVVEKVFIESNNGGRGFARNVEARMREAGNQKTYVQWFHQSGNKEAHILAASASVQNCIRFPKGWKILFPEFYRDVTTSSRMGKRKHDDAEDLLSGIIEKSVVAKIAFSM